MGVGVLQQEAWIQNPQDKVVNLKRKNRTNPRVNKAVAPSKDNRQQLLGSASIDTWQSVVILKEENMTISNKLNKRHPQPIPVQHFGVLMGRGPTRSCLRTPQHGERGSNQHLHRGAPSRWAWGGDRAMDAPACAGAHKMGTCNRLLICSFFSASFFSSPQWGLCGEWKSLLLDASHGTWESSHKLLLDFFGLPQRRVNWQ